MPPQGCSAGYPEADYLEADYLEADCLEAGYLEAGYLAVGCLAVGCLAVGCLAVGYLVVGYLVVGYLVADYLVADYLVADYLVAGCFPDWSPHLAQQVDPLAELNSVGLGSVPPSKPRRLELAGVAANRFGGLAEADCSTVPWLAGQLDRFARKLDRHPPSPSVRPAWPAD